MPPLSPARVDDLVARYGFSGQWQEQLLRAAAAPDGTITVDRLRRTLDTSDQLLTSDALTSMGSRIGSGPEPGVDSFEEARQRNIAHDIDTDRSGTLSAAEWRRFVTGVQKPGARGREWHSDQSVGVVEALVAHATGESHPLEVATANGATLLPKRYSLTLEDDQKRVPDLVAYQLTAADVLYTPAEVHRVDTYKADPAFPGSPKTTDYTGSGYDRGHQRPAEDSSDQAAMVESFLMTNIAPQRPRLNQLAWRLLEQGVNELVRATGGSATVITGGLFLDADGKPLPPERVDWIGRGGAKTVAVPTHYFKVVRLTTAEGETIPLAYVVPNRPDLPMKNPAMAALLRSCRTSIDQVEALSGLALYPALGETGDQGVLEATSAATIRVPHPELYKTAALLWPQVQQTRAVTTSAARDRRFPAFIPSLWDRTV